jgi:hypothetical protein
MDEIARQTIVLFYEFDFWFGRDQTGYNKIGYVTLNNEVVFPRRSVVVRRPMNVLRGKSIRTVRLPAHCSLDNVETFFAANMLTQNLFYRGINAIVGKEQPEYLDNPIKLPILNVNSARERERKWNEMRMMLRSGDMLFSVDVSDPISRLVAWIDGGPWSHTFAYAGDSKVYDVSVARGVFVGDLDAYKKSSIRLGLYRAKEGCSDDKFKIFAEFMNKELGSRYDYWTAASIGARKFVRNRRKNTGLRGVREVTPNELASAPELKLLFVV